MKRAATFLMTSFAVAGLSLTGAYAAEFEVKMLNKASDGRAWEFDPPFLKIAPGDTVTFVPADKGHNSETVQDMVPEGAEPWKGKINETVSVTYEQEGVYVYRCLPHAALGMVGVIQVGESTANLEAATAAKIPGKGKTRAAELAAMVGS